MSRVYCRVIPLRVSDDQHTLLEELAAERGLGLSPLIRELLFAVRADGMPVVRSQTPP